MNFPAPRMKRRKAIDIACGLGLLSLALIVTSVVSPRPIPVFLAMTLGQVIGTISFVMFLIVVAFDLRRAKVFDEVPAASHEASKEAPKESEPSASAGGSREALN